MKVIPAPSGCVIFVKDDVVILDNDPVHLTENGGRTWISIGGRSWIDNNITYHDGNIYAGGPNGVVRVAEGSIHKEPCTGLCFLDDGTLVSTSHGGTIHLREGDKWRQVRVRERYYQFVISSCVTALRNNGFICISDDGQRNLIARTYDKGTTWIKNYTGIRHIGRAKIIECPNGDIVIGGFYYAARISGGIINWHPMVNGPLTCFHLRDDALYGTWCRKQFRLEGDDWHDDGAVVVPLNRQHHLRSSANCLWFGQNLILENAVVLTWTDSGCVVATSNGVKSICIDWSVPNHCLMRSPKQKKIRNILLSFRRAFGHFVLFLAVVERLF